mmetsp:Transcript_7304/g.10340  ORF Transcript_7304/g.10340 Transcript_7304/m.10340 type:complete len:99 (-) Transcript_7304:8-304(-)
MGGQGSWAWTATAETKAKKCLMDKREYIISIRRQMMRQVCFVGDMRWFISNVVGTRKGKEMRKKEVEVIYERSVRIERFSNEVSQCTFIFQTSDNQKK